MRPTTLSIVLALLLVLHLSACTGLPTGRLQGGARSAEVPARFHGNHVLVPVHINGAGPIWMLLDTGASMTILEAAAARELGVGIGAVSELRGQGTETVRGGVTAEPISIQVAGSQPYRLQRPVADLSPLEPLLGAPLQGILGGDFFVRFVVEIDYAGERLVLHDRRQFRRHPDDVRLDVAIDQQLPFIHGAVVLADGRELGGRFLIDTGHDGNLVLNSPFVRSHAILEAAPSTIEYRGMGIGGETVRREGRLRGFQLSAFLLERPVVSLDDPDAEAGSTDQSAGIVGAGVLRRFTVTIDYRRAALYLRPNARLSEPFEASLAGFGLTSAPPRFQEHTVSSVADGSPAAAAGLRVGDVLLEVDGRPAAEFTLPEIAELTRQEPGRLLQLRVRRGDETRAVAIHLERRI